jgi:hypothetical protein
MSSRVLTAPPPLITIPYVYSSSPLAQVRLVGSNFQDVLHAEIAADQLPPEYGGTSVER